MLDCISFSVVIRFECRLFLFKKVLKVRAFAAGFLLAIFLKVIVFSFFYRQCKSRGRFLPAFFIAFGIETY